MNKAKWMRPAILLWLVGILVVAGCRDAVDSQSNQVETTPEQAETPPDQNQEDQDKVASHNLDDWLQQIQVGVIDSYNVSAADDAEQSFRWGGVIAIPSPEDVGAKYLVYAQNIPGDDFIFLGVVMVVDAITRESANMGAYTHGAWDHLPWLGDAAGPFWQQVPAGGSGDPAKTTEGRPGVLFVHEGQYQALK